MSLVLNVGFLEEPSELAIGSAESEFLYLRVFPLPTINVVLSLTSDKTTDRPVQELCFGGTVISGPTGPLGRVG